MSLCLSVSEVRLHILTAYFGKLSNPTSKLFTFWTFLCNKLLSFYLNCMRRKKPKEPVYDSLVCRSRTHIEERRNIHLSFFRYHPFMYVLRKFEYFSKSVRTGIITVCFRNLIFVGVVKCFAGRNIKPFIGKKTHQLKNSCTSWH